MARSALRGLSRHDDVVLTNNMIVNNVTGFAGAVALSGVTENVRLVNNTIANNVSTATTQQAFAAAAGAPTNPQVAGVALLDGPAPRMLNNILWGNRSYIFVIGGATTKLCNPGATGLNPDSGACQYNQNAGGPSYRDIGFLGTGNDPLQPRYTVFSDTAANRVYVGLPLQEANCSNTTPLIPVGPVCNKFLTVPPVVDSTTLFAKANDFTDSLLSAVTVDEGGNFVNVIYSPLTLWDIDAGGNVLATPRADYHVKAGSIAVNNARNSGSGIINSLIGADYVPAADFDAQTRRQPGGHRCG